jgi:alanyl-tRNA synthetase
MLSITQDITENTKVIFDASMLDITSTIIVSQNFNDDPSRLVVISKQTPFHPVDYKWPDQPSDHGVIKVANEKLIVKDCYVGAYNTKSKELFIDSEIPISKNENSGWLFLVVHIADNPTGLNPANLIGEQAILIVESKRRNEISAAHTGCHLMALALNSCLSDFWKKDFQNDSLGNPDFDQAAIQKSIIQPCETLDVYRIGKSLRKKGFDAVRFWESIGDVSSCMTNIINRWIESNSYISLTSEGDAVNSKRSWFCELDGKKAFIPCGGTHLDSLSRFLSIKVSLDGEIEKNEFTIKTSVGVNL